MHVDLVPASPAHVGTIARRMRPMDRLECAAMGHGAKQALRLGLQASSICLTARVDGRPEAMVGLVVTNMLCGEGSPWMLGTEAVYRHPRAMIAIGPRILAMMLDSTPSLSQLVARRNSRAIRMLGRWGFTIGKEAFVIAGTEFLPFSMERRHV